MDGFVCRFPNMSHLEADVISLTAAVTACASAMHWEVVMDLLAEHDGNEATYQAAVPWCQTSCVLFWMMIWS